MPSSCHHCQRPSCLPECPTGAIGRGPDGEVFIREQLCTGCGACERALSLAEHSARERARTGGVVAAFTCDLCAGAATPACVAACPTSAITRGAPERVFGELARLTGAAKQREPEPARRRGVALRVGVGVLAVALLSLAASAPPARAGIATGTVAGLLVLALVAQGVRKRLPRTERSDPRSSSTARSGY